MATDTDGVRVVLRVDHRLDDPEQHCLAVLGSSNEMGCWKPDKAIRAEYMGRSTWQAVVKLPPNESVVWKWVVIDVNSSEIVEWESGVDKLIEVRDKPLMGICEWGNPVDVTDISSESSVRLFQGVHDIGELSPCRRRDRTREPSIERRGKQSTERRKRSTERRRRSTERRKHSLERNIQAKGGKGKKVKRVKSKTKVTEDSTDKLRNVKSQNCSDAKLRVSSAKDVKAIAAVCQLSPTDSSGESRFMIPEAPVKIKHSNGLKEFFLKKLRSQASKARTHGKVLRKRVEAEKDTFESHSDKDSLSETSREPKCVENTDINLGKKVAPNRETVHSTNQTAKHTVLGKNLLNSILSDENLTEEIKETSELELNEENFNRNIDSADVKSFVSLGFATDCIISFDKTFDPFENTALIDMNMKDYDLVSSASDSLITSDKATHTLMKTKSEDSLYGYTVAARHTDVNMIERRKETDNKLFAETETQKSPLQVTNGDCNGKSVKDTKDSFEKEHSAEIFAIGETDRKPQKMVNEMVHHALPSDASKGLKHTEGSREVSVSLTTVPNSFHANLAKNIPKDDTFVENNPVQTYSKETESLLQKNQPQFETQGVTKENDIKVSEVRNETKGGTERKRLHRIEVSAIPNINDGHYLEDEVTDERNCAVKQTPEYTNKSFARNDDHLQVNDGTCLKVKYDNRRSLKSKKCNETVQLIDSRLAPKVPAKTFRQVSTLTNNQEKNNISERVSSFSAKYSREDSAFNNSQFCRNTIKVEHGNQSKFNGKAVRSDIHAKRTDHSIQVKDKEEDIKDNASEMKSNRPYLDNINEGSCTPDKHFTRMDHQNDDVNSSKISYNPSEKESTLEQQNQCTKREIAYCPGTQENRAQHQVHGKTKKEASEPDMQMKLVEHKNRAHRNEVANDRAVQINFKSKTITFIDGKFGENLDMLQPGDKHTKALPSHEKDLAKKKNGCDTKPSTPIKSDLYSCHSIANKYLSAVKSQDVDSHSDTTVQPSDLVTSKIIGCNSEKPKSIETNTELNSLPSSKAKVVHGKNDIHGSADIKDFEIGKKKLENKDNDQRMVNISGFEKEKYYSKTDRSHYTEYAELGTQEICEKDDAQSNISHIDSVQWNADKGLSRKLFDEGVSQKNCNVENKLDETRILDKCNQLEKEYTFETDFSEPRHLHGETTVTANMLMANLTIDSTVNDINTVSVKESEQISSLVSVGKENRSTSNNSKASHTKDKSGLRKKNDTITYIDETDQISPRDKNITRKLRSPISMSPNSKVCQWLKQRNTETDCGDLQGMCASQTYTPKDVDEYLNDLHKETPSYTKSVVALLEQNINCDRKLTSEQQTLDDGYEVNKKYSECNKTIDYANVSCGYSPRSDQEEKEQNIQTDVLASKGKSLWDLVERYKVPIGVSIAAACATVLICKKKL